MKIRFIYLILLAFLFNAGCAVLPVQENQEQILKSKVEGLMQAKVDNKWDIVYSYFDPDFKKNTSMNNFSSRSRNMRFKSFNIDKIEILPSGDKANINVIYEVSIQGFDFKGGIDKQTWIKEKGQWFLKVKKSQSSPDFGLKK